MKMEVSVTVLGKIVKFSFDFCLFLQICAVIRYRRLHKRLAARVSTVDDNLIFYKDTCFWKRARGQLVRVCPYNNESTLLPAIVALVDCKEQRSSSQNNERPERSVYLVAHCDAHAFLSARFLLRLRASSSVPNSFV